MNKYYFELKLIISTYSQIIRKLYIKNMIYSQIQRIILLIIHKGFMNVLFLFGFFFCGKKLMDISVELTFE